MSGYLGEIFKTIDKDSIIIQIKDSSAEALTQKELKTTKRKIFITHSSLTDFQYSI